MGDVTDYQAADVAVGTRLSALLTWRPLESWQTVLAGGVAVLLAAVLSLVLTGKDPASAATFITSVTRGEIVYADGTERAATMGARLPNGASLRTGDGGGARLTTDGRDVYVGGLSTVTVVDGVHQRLERGLVMIDANSGPGLTLGTVGAGTVNAPSRSLARVEQNVGTLRLAVYRAEASITAEGRRATSTVSALHQVRVPYGGVPEAPTALALTIKEGVYDTWEQRLAANLVQADVDLNSFAVGLNGAEGQVVLDARPASLRQTTLQGRRGEQALTVAVAQKARANAGDVRKNLEQVQRDRSDGGSWGVVAAIVQAPVSDVTSVLGSSLDDPSNPTVIAIPRPRQVGGEPQPSITSGPETPRVTPTGRPTSRPTTPAPTDPVQDAVQQVTGMLPPTPTPPVPSPTAAPEEPTVGTLLGTVLDLLSP